MLLPLQCGLPTHKMPLGGSGTGTVSGGHCTDMGKSVEPSWKGPGARNLPQDSPSSRDTAQGCRPSSWSPLEDYLRTALCGGGRGGLKKLGEGREPNLVKANA